MVPCRYEHVLMQALYEPWFVLLRVLNLVRSLAMQEVVSIEVMKLLDVGIIYPIFDSK
jgi:hypothetical protein